MNKQPTKEEVNKLIKQSAWCSARDILDKFGIPYHGPLSDLGEYVLLELAGIKDRLEELERVVYSDD